MCSVLFDSAHRLEVGSKMKQWRWWCIVYMLLMLSHLKMCLAIRTWFISEAQMRQRCENCCVYLLHFIHATPDVYIHQFFLFVEGKFLCLIFRRMLDIVSPDVFLRALAGFGTHTKSVLYILYSFPSCKLNYHDSPAWWRQHIGKGWGRTARFMSGHKKSSPLFEIIILTTWI